METRVCEVCGEEFEPRRKDQRGCSAACARARDRKGKQEMRVKSHTEPIDPSAPVILAGAGKGMSANDFIQPHGGARRCGNRRGKRRSRPAGGEAVSRNRCQNPDKANWIMHGGSGHSSGRRATSAHQKGGNPKPCYTAGRAVPSHAANRGIKARTAAATAARLSANTRLRVAPTVASEEQGHPISNQPKQGE